MTAASMEASSERAVTQIHAGLLHLDALDREERTIIRCEARQQVALEREPSRDVVQRKKAHRSRGNAMAAVVDHAADHAILSGDIVGHCRMNGRKLDLDVASVARSPCELEGAGARVHAAREVPYRHRDV